jgi:hypothetical protein
MECPNIMEQLNEVEPSAEPYDGRPDESLVNDLEINE